MTAERSVAAGDSSTRLSIGIDGIDEILGGGLPAGSSYLLVGGAGSGKTILSLQFLMRHAGGAGKPVYITLAEPATSIRRNAAALGWAMDCIEFVDLSPTQLPSDEGEYHVFSPSEVEQSNVWRALIEALEQQRPRVAVIDSVTQLAYLSTDDYQFRKQILALVAMLNRIGCTALLIYEPAMLAREASAGLAVDGILRLTRNVSPGLAIALRSVEVEKLRGSDFLSGPHPMLIGPDGINVFPHRIETLGGHKVGEIQISSGVPGLDDLLGGGIESGTATLLSGPAGAGKSTLGLQFLAQAASRGIRGVMYTFEESVEIIRRRCGSVGIPVAALLDSGMLRIERVNPLQLYPDQLLAGVRESVEQDGRAMVMLDSLRGYELAMEEYGKAKAHIHNLVMYLNRKGVTTVLVSEVEDITSASLRATDLGVSHLADSIVLMRYAEYGGQVIKIISCLKKRMSDFEPELRRLTISAQGIRVSEKLQHLSGILTGIPTGAGAAG